MAAQNVIGFDDQGNNQCINTVAGALLGYGKTKLPFSLCDIEVFYCYITRKFLYSLPELNAPVNFFSAGNWKAL